MAEVRADVPGEPIRPGPGSPVSSSRLGRNIAAMGVLQAANYLLPLLAVPYLVRILGPERFGLLAFAQALTAYFGVLTEYGFNLSATREIARRRGEGGYTARVFAEVMTVKGAFLLVGAVVMAGMVLAVPSLRREWALYVAAYAGILGNVLFPQWLFQGLERLERVAALQVAGKAVGLLGIFVLVQDATDYALAAAAQSGGAVLAGLLGFWHARRFVARRLSLPSPAGMARQLRAGWHVFVATGAITLYTNTNTVMLGVVAGPLAVGYYSAAEKLVGAARSLLVPAAQALYPHVSALVERDGEAARAFLRTSLRWITLYSLAISAGVLLGARPLVDLVLGAEMAGAVPLVQVMAAVPFLVGVNNLLGVQTMLTFGLTREFSRVLLGSGAFNVAILLPLAWGLGALGAAIAVVATETLVTLAMALLLARAGLAVWRAPRGTG